MKETKIIDLDRRPRWRPVDLTGRSANAGWAFLCVAVLALAAVLSMPTRSAGPTPDSDRRTASVQLAGRSALAVGVTVDGVLTTLTTPGEFGATGLRAISIAVLSPEDGDAFCTITVDGVEVDHEAASRGGMALCVWTRGEP